MQSIRSIADALQVDMQVALLAAGNLVTAPPPVDPREDPVIRAILNNGRLTEAEKSAFVKRELDRIEQDQARRLADYEFFLQQREGRDSA